MTFQGIEVSTMTDAQLSSAAKAILVMTENRNQSLQNKKKRHDKFNFDIVNPHFKDVAIEIEQELKKRKA